MIFVWSILNEADFDSDGVVSFYDLSMFCTFFGKDKPALNDHRRADFNRDEDVDGSDLARFTLNFNSMRCIIWEN